jgi:hypothetical protein
VYGGAWRADTDSYHRNPCLNCTGTTTVYEMSASLSDKATQPDNTSEDQMDVDDQDSLMTERKSAAYEFTPDGWAKIRNTPDSDDATDKLQEMEDYIKELKAERKRTRKNDLRDLLDDAESEYEEECTKASIKVATLAAIVTEEKFKLVEEKAKSKDFDLATLAEFIDSANKVASVWRKDSAKITEYDKLRELIGQAKMLHATLAKSRQVASAATNQARLVELGFAMDYDFVGWRDLEVFSERVESLFSWHKTQYAEYVAPYFPIVQSSGMGKTRIMVEYRKQQARMKPIKLRVMLILCRSDDEDETDVGPEKTFDEVLIVPDSKRDADRDAILRKLDSWVHRLCQLDGVGPVVLMFDESQHLVSNGGWAFRVVRWWLRKIRGDKVAAVSAVFAGTSSALANFYKEPQKTQNSRDPAVKEYHDKGTTLYEPFFDICTIGCTQDINIGENPSDYERAIPYGRPLFALMHHKNELDRAREHAILQRMLLSQRAGEWEKNKPALLSILATRVQMGQTSSSVVSTLVSLGYANLTYFQRSNPSVDKVEQEDAREVADFCYFTDPVCSRLAMCLMDSNWTSGEYNGQDPKFWAEAAFDMFANGLCRPNKGDLGEIAVALYFLFTADSIRGKQRLMKHDDYRTFGIPFPEWFKALSQEPTKPNEAARGERRSKRIAELHAKQRQAEADARGKTEIDGQVSFMQFQRLYLRLPFSVMLTPAFLKDLYLSGTACFLYSAAPVFDFVASIQESEEKYRALLISVKARHTFRATDVENEFAKMKAFREEAGATEQISNACCMLVLVGLEDQGNTAMPENTQDLLLVVIPREDTFGCSRLVTVSTYQAEQAEIYCSHGFLKSQNVPSDEEARKEFAKDCLRASGRAEPVDYLDFLLKHIEAPAVASAKRRFGGS